MHTLLDIYVGDVDGHIQVTTQEITVDCKLKFDFLLATEDSIIELLEPILYNVWDPISRRITPKHLVVKLEDIHQACVALYCHFLDRDWPLVALNISPFGDISEWEALKMAASYYRHLDRHTPPLFTQPLPVFPQVNYSQVSRAILGKNAGIFYIYTHYVPLKNKDVREVGCANLLYLLRRSLAETLHLNGEWDNSILLQFLPGLRELRLRRLIVDVIPEEYILLLSDVVWQNPRLVRLELEKHNLAAFLKLDSTAHFLPLTTPECCLHGVHENITFMMEELKSSQVVYCDSWGDWDEWVSYCPSLVNVTRLKCLVKFISGVEDPLTQLEALVLVGTKGLESWRGETVVPPNVHTLNLSCPLTKHGWPHKIVFPTYLQKLKLSNSAKEVKNIPIDVLLNPLTCLTHLQTLKVNTSVLISPDSDFPSFSSWPNLAYLTLELATVTLAHQILASVPTTQWRGLHIAIQDENPNREGMFKGLKDADWRHLKQLGMHYVDFVIHANMLKQFHGLVDLFVKNVPYDSSPWPRLMEVLNPNSHPELQTLQCFHYVPSSTVKRTNGELAWLLSWPTLIRFPDYDIHLQSRWNGVRQSKLVELAVHPLKLVLA